MNDVVLAIYSDRLFMAAVGVYVLAMALHAAEYAALRSAHGVPRAVPVAAAAPRPRRRRSTRLPGPARPRTRADRSAGRRRTWSCLRAAAVWVDRHPRAGRRPLAAGQHVRVHLRGLPRRGGDLAGRAAPLPALRAVALFVLLPVVILLFLAGTVLYARAAPVVPALRSYWLVVHVTTITVSSGLLLVPGVASLLSCCAGPPGWRAGGPAAFGGDAGPAGLPHHDRRLPAVHVRRHRRGDLGRGRVGPVLGLGPQGDRRVRRLGRVRRLPARTGHRGLAHRPRRVDQRRRAGGRALQLVLHQHGRRGPPLLRGL